MTYPQLKSQFSLSSTYISLKKFTLIFIVSPLSLKTSHHYQYNHKPKPSTSLPIRLLTLMSIVHYVNRQIGRGVESLLKRWLFLHRNHCLDRNININFLHWNYIFLFSERSITEIASLP